MIQDRLQRAPSGSYTATLTPSLLKEKIMEEAGEVIGTETKEQGIWEVSDLLYFVSVLMAQKGVAWNDILKELERRNRYNDKASDQQGQA